MRRQKSEVVCGAGHYPEELGSAYDRRRLVQLATGWLERRKPVRVISGMAAGWDHALALAAVTLAIPLIAAVPYPGFEEPWSEEHQQLFHDILELATEVHFLAEPGASTEKRRERNLWMVDRSDKVLALWNGAEGGTAHCIRYAREQGKPVDNLWEKWLK